MSSRSRKPGSTRTNPFGVVPPQATPGPTGKNDYADPLSWLNWDVWSLLGDTPGPVGVNDHADPAARTLAKSSGETPASATKKLNCKGVVAAGGPLNEATIDLINEAVKKQSNKRYIAYQTVVRVGGNIPWRFNNPGNLRYAKTQLCTAPGQVGVFAVFATMDEGRAAQKALYLDTYGSFTVHDAIYKLTPPEDQNNTEAYLKRLKTDGIDLDKDVKSQIDKLMIAVQKQEGLGGVGVEVTRAK